MRSAAGCVSYVGAVDCVACGEVVDCEPCTGAVDGVSVPPVLHPDSMQASRAQMTAEISAFLNIFI